MGRRRKISLELLESRQLLHAAGLADQLFPIERATSLGEDKPLWSEADHRTSPVSFAGKPTLESSFIGPRRFALAENYSHQQWKVWLDRTTLPDPATSTEPATSTDLGAALEIDALLDSEFVNFNVITVFDSPIEQADETVLLVESFSTAEDLAASSLASRAWVSGFQPIDPAMVEMESVSTTSPTGSSDALQLLSSAEATQVIDFQVTTGQDSVDANVGDGICADAAGACSLRAAIQEANAAAPSERTIMLDVAEVLLDLPHQPDSNSNFPTSEAIDGLPGIANATGWSNETSGDLDILGSITIIGNAAANRIAGSGTDRIFKVHPGASLSLHQVTLTGGVAPADQGGGGILSAGTLRLDQVVVSGNVSLDESSGLGGGGIALWGGSLEMRQSTVDSNNAEIGGGVLAAGGATVSITQSTLVGNVASVGEDLTEPDPNLIGGGGIVGLKSGAINVENTTLSANTSVNAAGAAIGVFSLVPRQEFDSADVPRPIPDVATVTSELTVSGFNDVISDVNVTLSIDHTFNGDLSVHLISPSGTRVELFSDVGAGSNNFTETVLDDEALDDFTEGSAPYTGTFRPLGQLSDFVGEDPNGTWQLQIEDTTINDIGTLQSWSLDLEPQDGSSARGNLRHVTVALHEGASSVAGRVGVKSSLLAGNQGEPIGAGVRDLRFNVIADADSIGPLQDLGGPTMAHPLKGDNPAIDGGDLQDFPAVDQIGTLRPIRGRDFQTAPDVGAVEMVGGSARGIIFVDRNGDGAQQPEELGVPGFSLFVDLNQNGQFDDGEPQTLSEDGEDLGSFDFQDLPAGPQRIYLQVPSGWTITHQPTAEGVRGDADVGRQYAPSLSFDGNTVAYYWDIGSDPDPVVTNLQVLNRVTGTYYSPNFVDDLGFPFSSEVPYSAFDQPSVSADGNYIGFVSSFENPFLGSIDSIEVVDTRVSDGIPAGLSVASELTGFIPSDGMISADGRYVAFTSNGDVYVSDRQQEEILLVSAGLGDQSADGASFNASISREGRFVAFESEATNLVDLDNNNRTDVFLTDRVTGTTQRVSVADDGAEADGDSVDSSISGDGRFVVFSSTAANLVDGDVNGLADIFLYDRQDESIQRISESSDGIGGDAPSTDPAISSDGRFVVFASASTNLVEDDTSAAIDLFVFDRQSGAMVQIAEAAESPAISGDGKFIAYVQGDDTWVVSNPLASRSDRTVIAQAGQTAVASAFGLVPDDGEIRGTVFDDVEANGIRDATDPGLEGWLVYLDLSGNGQLDADEPQTLTDSLGNYQFENLPGYANYLVRVDPPSQWQPVVPDPIDGPLREVFVDAGTLVNGADFGFSQIDSIILEGSGETVVMASLDEFLKDNVRLIDIRGTGDNALVLDAVTIQTRTPNQTLLAIADLGDEVQFDQGWEFSGTQTIEGQFERIFVNGAATLRLIGPSSWTNPINPADIDGSGGASAFDALTIINALARRAVIDDDGNLFDPTTINPSLFRFYDANQDGRMSASDALAVINRLAREQSSGEPEQTLAPSSLLFAGPRFLIAEDVDAAIAATRLWR
jgi:CSLREA domain-containing protein